MTDKLYRHFLSDDGCLANSDGRKVVVGETYRIEDEPILCDYGFHASKCIIDALQYSPGAMVCQVQLGGTIIDGDDKVVAQERTVLWMYDATRVLHEFALWCAEEALKLVDKPDPRSLEALRIKRLWLDGGATDEELSTARDAARAAAWDAAWDAARAAAWDARDAAWAAAWDAARAAAWADARDAAWAAAWDARDAAWDAAWAARAAAWDAWDAAWATQNVKLEQMIVEAKPNDTQ